MSSSIFLVCRECGRHADHYVFRKTGQPHPRCKDCTKARARARYESDPATVMARVKRYRATPKGRAVARAAVKKSSARPEAIASAAARMRVYRSSGGTRLADKARDAVRAAVESGALRRPAACDRCSREPGASADGRSLIQFHHTEGYEPPKWLVGAWLCTECHAAEHSTARRALA